MRHPRRLTVLLVAAAALTVAACGGGSDETSGGATTEVATRDAFDRAFKCICVQFGLENADQFVFAHEGFPPFHGIVPVQTVGLPGTERHVI